MENLLLGLLDGVGETFDAERVIKLLIIIAVTVAAYVALVILRRRLKARLNLDHSEFKKRHAFITVFRVAKALVIISGIVMMLQTIGINLTGLTTGLGLIILLLMLAIKDYLQDVFAGLTIMTDKFFSVGDAVEFDGRDGIVVSFTVRTTKIEFLDDRSVLSVTNRNISKIRKLTHLVDIDVPLPYELDRKRAFELLSGICDDIRGTDGVESCELKGTQEFGTSAVFYKIRFFCEPNDRPDIRREAHKKIQDGLAKAGVAIPYQQIDIHSKPLRPDL